MADSKMLVLIPAWNEEEFIGPIITAAAAHHPVLVVDDGSDDATPSLAAELGATVVRHERNRGKGLALVTGFEWAVNEGFDAVITLDADGQHDPQEIPKFTAQYRTSNADLIVGRRRFGQMPFPNNLANLSGSFLLTLALRKRIYDNQCGYRLYTRRLLRGLNLQATGFELEVEVIVMAVCKGFALDWVDIRTIYGTGKKSYFHPWHDSIRFLKMVGFAYRTRRSYVGRERS